MLYDSLRSEPLIARTCIVYASWATRVRSALRVTSFASAGSPFGSGMFQLMSNCGAVDGGLERQADAVRAEVVDGGAVDRAGQRRRAA